MKKSVLTILITICFSSICYAGSVGLQWNANSEPDLDGYRLYYGPSSGTYEKIVNVGNVTSYIIDDEYLAEGHTFYFAVTAYDTDLNESGYSNEVSKEINNVAPANPQNLETIQNTLADLTKFLNTLQAALNNLK